MGPNQAAELNNQGAAEMEATLDRILEELRELHDKMSIEDAEIARLKAEAAELKAATRAILATLRRAA